jgi:hypothetical protein
MPSLSCVGSLDLIGLQLTYTLHLIATLYSSSSDTESVDGRELLSYHTIAGRICTTDVGDHDMENNMKTLNFTINLPS